MRQNAAVGVLVQPGPPAAPEGVRGLAQLARRAVWRSQLRRRTRRPEISLVVVSAVLSQREAAPLPETMPSGCAVIC